MGVTNKNKRMTQVIFNSKYEAQLKSHDYPSEFGKPKGYTPYDVIVELNKLDGWVYRKSA